MKGFLAACFVSKFINGRRVAGLGTMVCQHMHVRPIPLLRVRISEGLTQANS